jgi:hypothetical protein
LWPLCLILFLQAVPAHGALTAGARLSAIYDTILAARFDDARAQLAGACPPAPPEACQALEVVAVWWEIQLDPNNRRLDARLEQAAASSIAAARRSTQRESTRAEAWFYLGGSYGPLVQWRVLRGKRLAAARDGKRIKDALERALALDPTLQDAHFGIGLYHYYADVVPAALKAFRWLLLLPGGDRQQGLREMLQARDRGELLRWEAAYQLHWLYFWYEENPPAGLALLRELDDRFPSNPVFLQRIAEVQHEYFHDHAASAAAWRTLLARAEAGRVRLPRAALAHLELGLEYFHLADRDRAIASLNTAITLATRDDPDDVRSRARAAMRRF